MQSARVRVRRVYRKKAEKRQASELRTTWRWGCGDSCAFALQGKICAVEFQRPTNHALIKGAHDDANATPEIPRHFPPLFWLCPCRSLYSQAFSTSSPFVLSTEYELQFTVIIEVAPASISPFLTLSRAPGHPPVI